MKKKVLASMLVMLLMASVFVGCGNKPAETTDVDEAAKTLTVAMALSEEEWRGMREIVFAGFEEEYGIKVEGVHIEHGDMEPRLRALAAAGRHEIDLIAPDNMLLYPLVDQGLVKDLSQYEGNIPAEVTKNLYEDFKFDGKLYFMPFRPNVKINFYNEDKLAQYDLKPPSDWDELYEFAKTLHAEEGIGRIAFQATLGPPTTVTLFEFIRQAGGDPLVLNDEGSIAAYTFLQELWPYVSPEAERANFNVMNQILANEAVYYGDNWPFAANIIVDDGGKIEIKANAGFDGPAGNNKVLGGNVFAVVEGTQAEEEAIKFIEYILSKEVQEQISANIGWPSARDDAYASIAEWQVPYFEAVNEAMSYAQPRPVVSYWSEVDRALNEAFVEIVIEGRDVKSTLDTYHEVIARAKAATQ